VLPTIGRLRGMGDPFSPAGRQRVLKGFLVRTADSQTAWARRRAERPDGRTAA
jgi:hypothetical protein